jgi:hypothetical protein
MKPIQRLFAAGLLAGFCLSSSAQAPAPAPTAAASAPAKAKQQSKMGQCSAQAKGMKGDERKAFMKGCLSKKGAPSAAPA